jgi:hypothetical protein
MVLRMLMVYWGIKLEVQPAILITKTTITRKMPALFTCITPEMLLYHH